MPSPIGTRHTSPEEFLEFHRLLHNAVTVTPTTGEMKTDIGRIREALKRVNDNRADQICEALSRYARHGVAIPRLESEKLQRPALIMPWGLIEDTLGECWVPPGAVLDFLGLVEENDLEDLQRTVSSRFVSVPEYLFRADVADRLQVTARFRLLQRRDLPGWNPQLLPQEDYGRPDAYEPAAPRRPPGVIVRPTQDLPDPVDCLFRAVSNTLGSNGITFWICLDDACTRSLEAALANGGPSAAEFVFTVAKFVGASVVSATGITTGLLATIFGSVSPWGMVAVMAQILAQSISAAMLRDNNHGQGVCIRVVTAVGFPYVTPAGP